MYLTVHGHFYQPPRENPWTGRIPLQESASPYHDWNERICAQCYAPNAHSRVLDPRGRIEEILSNYDWINFDFGPTLLRWLEREKPAVYRRVLEADARSVRRREGHGNAIAQAYSHMILPLANTRDKRTQIAWGLRDFEHRFGRRSESLWLPETAVDAETLQVLSSFAEIRYLILAPRQARRIRPLSGGKWTDVSGGRIDPRRPYRLFLKSAKGDENRHLDIFFYDGALGSGISFEHMLRNAEYLARHIEAAAHDGTDTSLVHVATDGEVYGHHEPFGDMCLAYLFEREAPRRGIRVTNYGSYLETHPPEHEVELDFGKTGQGSSWSCIHGIERWQDNCGCSTGGRSGWNQEWRSPLRQGLNRLRDRLTEVFLDHCDTLLRDPWDARDDYVQILLDRSLRESFLKRHARGSLTHADRRTIWRLIESQHQGMLMFTSCAWFFADVSGIEVQQNLTYAARAIDLAQPFSSIDLEDELLVFLAAAESNVPGIGTGADIWRRFVRPMRRSPALVAMESVALLAARASVDEPVSTELGVELDGIEGDLESGIARAHVAVADRSTEEVFRYLVEARKDPSRLMILTATEESIREDHRRLEASIHDLTPEARVRIARALFAHVLEKGGARMDEIFEASLPMLERYHDEKWTLPSVFKAISTDVLARRCDQIAARLARLSPRALAGRDLVEATRETFSLAGRVGVEPVREGIAAVIENALDANLGDAPGVTEEDLARSVELLQVAGSIGIKIARTKLEENVYALLSNHREMLAARSAGHPEPRSGVNPDTLAQLAELSNLSLCSFERTRSTPSEENVEGVTG